MKRGPCKVQDQQGRRAESAGAQDLRPPKGEKGRRTNRDPEKGECHDVRRGNTSPLEWNGICEPTPEGKEPDKKKQEGASPHSQGLWGGREAASWGAKLIFDVCTQKEGERHREKKITEEDKALRDKIERARTANPARIPISKAEGNLIKGGRNQVESAGKTPSRPC